MCQSTVSEASSVTMRHMLRATSVLAFGLLLYGSALAAPAAHPDTAGWKDLIAPDLLNVEMPAV